MLPLRFCLTLHSNAALVPTSSPHPQAIIGAIVYGWGLICNVLMFMFFFLLVFGILGVENFKGELQHRCLLPALQHSPSNTRQRESLLLLPRCVVTGPAVAGYVSMGPKVRLSLTDATTPQ